MQALQGLAVWLRGALALALVTAGCAARVRAVFPSRVHEARTAPATTPARAALPEGWVWFDAIEFRFAAPAELTQDLVDGTDSFVGRYHTESLRLSFDFGSYSGSPDNVGWRGPESTDYVARDVSVTGHPARLATWQFDESFNAALYVPQLDATGTALMFSAYARDAGTGALAVRILQTVTFAPVPGARPFERDPVRDAIRDFHAAESLPRAEAVAAYERSIAGFDRFVRLAPDDPQRHIAMFYAALAHERTNSPAEAAARFEAVAVFARGRLAATPPPNDVVRDELLTAVSLSTLRAGLCYEHLADWERAIERYRSVVLEPRLLQASEAARGVREAYISLGLLLALLERWPGARAAWLGVLPRVDTEQRAAVLHAAARAALRTGRPVVAERELAALLAPTARAPRSVALEALADRAEALAQLRQARRSREAYTVLLARLVAAPGAPDALALRLAWRAHRALGDGGAWVNTGVVAQPDEAAPSLAAD